MDKRRRRTRMRLQLALRDLLAVQPLSAITVEALCQRAKVTRPTFYANYANTAEMLEEYLTELLAEMERRHVTALEGVPCEERPARMRALSASIFRDLGAGDPRLAALVAGVPSLEAEARFARLVEGCIERGDPEGAAGLPAPIARMHAHFFTGAFIGLLRFWLAGRGGLDAELMAHHFTQLCLYGRLGAALPESEGSDPCCETS
ncbi:TetR/AcrR family transcriptional regulator [Roseivivax sp. CAU 1761]